MHFGISVFRKMNENAELAEIPSEPISPVKQKDPYKLAYMVIREGKDFRSSALAAGYSQSTANKGIKRLMRDSQAFSAAFQRESAAIMSLAKLKPFAVRRLYDEIIDPKSVGGLKAIEIAGRFKETDWFVRNMDVQVGVFAGFAGGPEVEIDEYLPQDDSKKKK